MPAAAKKRLRAPESDMVSSAADRLMRRVIARASQDNDPQDDSARTDEQVSIDASGVHFEAQWPVLRSLGRGLWEDFCAGPAEVVLSDPPEVFAALHKVLLLARDDVFRGICALRRSLADAEGTALSELLDSLGLAWTFGGRVHQAPSLLKPGSVISILELKSACSNGVLRHFANACSLPDGGSAFGKRGLPPRGVVRVARETAWARSLSDEAFTGEVGAPVMQLLDLALEPYSGPYGPQGCFQPYVLRDGDRMIFDLGPGRWLHLHTIVLGLAVIEGGNDELRFQIATAGSAAEGCARRSSAARRFSCLVRYRKHALEPHPKGGRSVAPPQLCTTVMLDMGAAAAAPSNAIADPLVDQIFAMTLHVPNRAPVGLYHAELFGELLSPPPELLGMGGATGATSSGSSTRPPFSCAHRGGLSAVRCQEPRYLEELQLLEQLGLLDRGMKRQMEALSYTGSEQDCWEAYGDDDGY